MFTGNFKKLLSKRHQYSYVMRTAFSSTAYLLILPFLLLIFACSPQGNQTLGTRHTDPDPFSEPGSRQAASSAETADSEMDINQDLAQPLEQEVTKAPPESEVYTLSPKDAKTLKTLPSQPEIDFELDIKETKTLEYYFELYTQTNHKSFQRWLKRAEPFLPYIRKVFTEKGLPQDLVFLPFAESGFNPWAYSSAGAAGLWQFIPSTARIYDLRVDWWIDERRDPYLSTHAAANFLSKLHNMFQDWYLALAAYNCGEGRVLRALKQCQGSSFDDISQSHKYLAKETRNYIPKILAILKIVRNLESLGFEPLDWSAPERPQSLEVSGGTDLLSLTRHLHLDWDEFRKMNPAFRRQATPPSRKSRIYLKEGLIHKAQAYLKSPESRPFAGTHRYQVRKGDSWWRIARRFNLPISVLKQANHTRSNLLRTGQWVLIPGSRQAQRAARSSGTRTPGAAKSYRVRSGDTLWSIANRFGLSVSGLRQANAGSLDGAYLHIGQTLEIPHPTARQTKHSIATHRANYTIQKGDTLWELSRRFEVSLQTLRTANGLTQDEVLDIGSKLYIPDMTPRQTRQSRERARASHQKILQYYVRKGDNLWKISNRFNISLQTLLAANNLTQGDVLHIGKQLQIPVPEGGSASTKASQDPHKTVIFHTISKGDTLWGIARRYQVTVQEIRSWNSLDRNQLLHPGQSLKILKN